MDSNNQAAPTAVKRVLELSNPVRDREGILKAIKTVYDVMSDDSIAVKTREYNNTVLDAAGNPVNGDADESVVIAWGKTLTEPGYEVNGQPIEVTFSEETTVGDLPLEPQAA